MYEMGVQVLSWEGAILRGRAPHCKVYGRSAASSTKAAEQLEAPFGLMTREGLRKRVLDGGPDPSMGKGATHCKV